MHDDGVTVFTAAFPIIITPDLGRALGFYRDLLDGQIEYQFPPEGDPGYIGMSIGGGHIGIGLAPDAAVERLRHAGTKVTDEPADQPWGERIARVVDPDGNEVIIGQRA